MVEHISSPRAMALSEQTLDNIINIGEMNVRKKAGKMQTARALRVFRHVFAISDQGGLY